jgi:hypothetical protein
MFLQQRVVGFNPEPTISLMAKVVRHRLSLTMGGPFVRETSAT